MSEADIFRYLNQGALVVMAGSFLWLVKTVTGDIRHDIQKILEVLQEMRSDLDRALKER